MEENKIVSCAGLDKAHFEDEVLETVWERAEQDAVTLTGILELFKNEPAIMLMIDEGLLTVDGPNVALSKDSESRARDIIRRHRLAERLFADVLDLQDFERDACLIEHAISPEVEGAICTMLGHPPTCPHGKPIPPGKCCTMLAKKMKPLVQSLRDMDIGKSAKVQFIAVPAIDRLASMGLVPGAYVRLSQKKPSFVIEIDETTIAVDEEIASGIYVRQV